MRDYKQEDYKQELSERYQTMCATAGIKVVKPESVVLSPREQVIKDLKYLETEIGRFESQARNLTRIVRGIRAELLKS